jgi:hypothetical protein
MMRVINIREMRPIIKQIFFSLALFFSYPHLGAMCPQTVGPISINNGTWSLLSRVGAANNAIQSQICVLNASVSLNNCIQFGQSDIGAGGVYTINSPGVYCMYDDANWSAGAAITVNSSNVTIDMQNHTLNGGSSGATGIVINGGLSGVTIKNGNITNPTSACIAKGGADLLLQNIIIQNMNFSVVNVAASYPAVSMQGGATDTQFYNVLIENCTGYNTYIILNPGLFAVVRGCTLSCNGFGASSSGNASITIQGLPQSSGWGQSALIEDCSIGNNNPIVYPTNNASFSITDMSTAIIRNCFSYGSGTDGFTLNAGINATLDNCVAQQSAQDGFFFSPGATPMNIVVANCVAQGCVMNGFWIKNLTGSGCKNVVFTNCVAQNNTQNGFYITNAQTATGIRIPITFRGCNSHANGGSGFELGFGGTGYSPIGYGSLFDCVASNNSSDGFFFSANVTTLKIEHCWAVHNGGVGFQDENDPSLNYYVGARSFNNTGGTYLPASIPNQDKYQYNSTNLGIINYGLNLYQD